MGIASPRETVFNLGKYTLLEKIGEGYLGSVYRGFDQDLDRAVAVRVLCDGIRWDSRIEELFYRQCRAVAGLKHPGIASVYDSGKAAESHYIVMESLGGASLQSLIAQKPAMTVESKISIMIQVAEGLGYAHRNGILHRDLSPAKIHLTSDGKAKIRDFAVANVLRKHLPHPAIRWGAPIYLAPEQVQQAECDPRSDLFSAGTIFYELLTYEHPFYDRDGNKALDNILLRTEIPTFESFPDLPPAVWPILKTCLEKNPDDRYRDLDAFADACRELQKDLEEDTRLILTELYAALSPLKKAASQLDASEDTVRLTHDIQQLLSGEKQPDYVSLDRLMTVLLEQYPVIRAAAGETADTRPADTPPQEKQKPAFMEKPGPSQPPLPAAPPAPAATQPERTVPKFFLHFDPVTGNPEEDCPAEPPEQMPAAGPSPAPQEHFAPELWDLAPAPGADAPAAGAEPETRPAAPVPEAQAETAAPEKPRAQAPVGQEDVSNPKPEAKSRYKKTRKRSHRRAAALMALLVIAAAVCIVWGPRITGSLGSLWKSRISGSRPISGILQFWRGDAGRGAVNTASADTFSLAGEAQGNATGFAEEDAVEDMIAEDGENGAQAEPSERAIARISALIQNGKLPQAKNEVDRLQRAFPGSSRVPALRRQVQAKDAAMRQEQALRDQEAVQSARRQKEEEWNRQLNALFVNGKYGDAEGVLNQWLAENPASGSAQAFGSRLGEIQRNLRGYAAAMGENRYQDALLALGNAERLNPADYNLAEMRRRVEARKSAARASLTVHRLGPGAGVLLDGKPVGTDGELEGESVPIGNHTVSIESNGTTMASWRQEFLEGQRVVLVYDRQSVRAMAEADRTLLDQRKAIEEARSFDAEHTHGTFRGSCRGVLSVNYVEVSYKPSAGVHGFRVPFKLLKVRVKGRTVVLLNASDNSPFQTFKLRDEQTASKFGRSWEELTAYNR